MSGGNDAPRVGQPPPRRAAAARERPCGGRGSTHVRKRHATPERQKANASDAQLTTEVEILCLRYPIIIVRAT